MEQILELAKTALGLDLCHRYIQDVSTLCNTCVIMPYISVTLCNTCVIMSYIV